MEDVLVRLYLIFRRSGRNLSGGENRRWDTTKRKKPNNIYGKKIAARGKAENPGRGRKPLPLKANKPKNEKEEEK
jgi:hypothetical protein